MATLRVVEIFDSLQGEGFWTGVPMTFVRLAGCNAPAQGLECVRWCDTPGSWDPEAGEEMDVGEIVRRASLPRLCVTGGEPLLQVEGVVELVATAHRLGLRVHLETNGTVDPWAPLGAGASAALPVGAGAPPAGAGSPAGAAPASDDGDLGFDWAVVSPKPPHYVIAPGWEGLVDELKLVVDDRLSAATAERLAAAHPGAIVSIQPEWGEASAAGRGRKSVEKAVVLVMSHPEWRLSLQVHKLLGIR